MANKKIENKHMNQLFSIFFSIYFFLGSMIPYTDFSQLLLLADTAEHYLEHKERAEISGEEFCPVEFIIEHYFEKNHSEENHDNLPLHNYNSSIELMYEITLLKIEFNSNDIFQVKFHTPSGVIFSDYTSNLERPPSRV